MSATQPAEIADGRLHLDVLYEVPCEPSHDLPIGLWRRYGGDLRLDAPSVVANFVTSVDGVVALEMNHSPSVISQHSDADRFVMGLLRARADAVLIGGRTMRADPGHAWTAEYIYPEAAGDFRELRRSHGQPEEPRLIVVTASGDLDVEEPALDGALVITSPANDELAGRLPPSTAVRHLDPITAEGIVRLVRDEGLGLILSEAGPQLFGEMVAAGCLGELFLTVSPLLAGSNAPDRKTLSSGLALPPGTLGRMALVSARRHDSHLFLRYRSATA